MTISTSDSVSVIRAEQRRHVAAGWYDSDQSFAGPANASFGPLVVHNDSVIGPKAGFPLHRHEQMEIITWIFGGAMEHADSEGNRTTIRPGLAQRLSAGTGILHSEMNPDPVAPSHGVQMWVRPDTVGAPSYAQADVSGELDSGELIPVASGRNPDAAVGLNQAGATLWAARPHQGATLSLPAAHLMHLFVGTGVVELESAGRLEKGDAARIHAADALGLSGALPGTEILIWTLS
jgi:redox-sensitive bicupin YhaK (pirin superfamily)